MPHLGNGQPCFRELFLAQNAYGHFRLIFPNKQWYLVSIRLLLWLAHGGSLLAQLFFTLTPCPCIGFWFLLQFVLYAVQRRFLPKISLIISLIMALLTVFRVTPYMTCAWIGTG
ncbi:MAG: hypothetical protein R3B47_17135 [Bacteroidia bacterium]